jgi:hypothetical protein
MQKTFVRNYGPRRMSEQEYLESLPTLNTPTTANICDNAGGCTCGKGKGTTHNAGDDDYVDPDSADALPTLPLPRMLPLLNRHHCGV